MRDGLKGTNRLAELPPLARICQATLELTLHCPDHARQDAAPLPAHRRVEQRHPGARLTEKLVARREAVLEEELAHRGRSEAHLRKGGSDRQAGCSSFEQEGA